MRAGQKIEWKFELVTGTSDYLLGTSDIEFKATYFKLPDKTSSESAASEESGNHIVPKKFVSGTTEEAGSFHVDDDGFLMLSWSNEHSSYRDKTINFSVDISDINNAEDFHDAEEG